MGGEVLLFNRQINNKLSKNIFYFLSLFCFCCFGSAAAGLLTRRKIRYQSRIKELRFSCAQPFYFFIFNTDLRFRLSFLPQPDRWVRTKV